MKASDNYDNEDPKIDSNIIQQYFEWMVSTLTRNFDFGSYCKCRKEKLVPRVFGGVSIVKASATRKVWLLYDNIYLLVMQNIFTMGNGKTEHLVSIRNK